LEDTAPLAPLNRFMLVNVAAQRARQLMQGAEPLLRTKSRKPAAIAVKEVNRGLLDYFVLGEELPVLDDALDGEALD